MLTLIKAAIKPENVTKKALNKFSSLRATSIKEIKIHMYIKKTINWNSAAS